MTLSPGPRATQWRSFVLSILAAWILFLLAAPALAAPAALPTLRIDPKQVTVSGVSSGAFMAVQVHFAHSDVFTGIGAVAGGPYLCAEGTLLLANLRCMRGLQPVPVLRLAARTRELARRGEIAPTAGLRHARVFLFSGAQDGTVKPGVVGALAQFYLSFVAPANLRLDRHPEAGHGMVTRGQGVDCHATSAPYLNDCGLDLAGELLSHLHPGLTPPPRGAEAPNLVEFDQAPFAQTASLAPAGWLYLPAGCRQGAQGPACRLHVVLHGCRQSAKEVGDTFVRLAGYNPWAEHNRIVVLYPQVGEALNSCWDWWGYDGDVYATRAGTQVRAIRRMVDALVGEGGRR